MACDIAEWKLDKQLRLQLENLVAQSTRRDQILDFMKQDFPQYPWSLKSVSRRLKFFGICYINRHISESSVQKAVEKEILNGNAHFGYRKMQIILRCKHKLYVSRDMVSRAMSAVDPQRVQQRQVDVKRNPPKVPFVTMGPNWTHSLDGHYKLMGYQRSTFPLAVFGCIDNASRKILWLHVWTDNYDPKLVGRWYLDYLMESKMIASRIRISEGAESGIIATMHTWLRGHHGDSADPTEAVIYGKSTSKQLQRWWIELHEKIEQFYEAKLFFLEEHGHYDPHCLLDRKILAFVFIPVLERAMTEFVYNWNAHRIGKQKNASLPSGVPNHIYAFPEQYNLQNCGWRVTEEQLRQVAEFSEVLQAPGDYLDPDDRTVFEEILNPDDVEPKDCATAYMFVKNQLAQRSSPAGKHAASGLTQQVNIPKSLSIADINIPKSLSIADMMQLGQAADAHGTPLEVFLFDLSAKAWSALGKTIEFRIEEECLGRGGLREVFKATTLTTPYNKKVWVVKKLLQKTVDNVVASNQSAEEHCRQVVQMHLLSKNITMKLAEYVKKLGNAAEFGPFFQYTDVHFAKMKSGESITLEIYLGGLFNKYISSNGEIAHQHQGSTFCKKAECLTHFSHIYSDGCLMILDIQGVGYTLSGPEIASKKQKDQNRVLFGMGNLSVHAISRFIRSHVCNEFCRLAGLKALTFVDDPNSEVDKN